MNKLLLTFSFLISLICFTSQSWALPPCPTSGYKNNCYGSYKDPSGYHYLGEFKNNEYHGYGIATWKEGDIYRGQYKSGKKNGLGTHISGTGIKYVGEYKDNKRNGMFLVTYKNGSKYEGLFKNDKKHGQGTATLPDGKIIKGIWKNGKFMYANKPISSPNSKIEKYRSFCSEIGFTPGTEKFGECVVEAMKKG